MPLVEEGDKSRRELGWLVLLHEMASPGDYLEACTGDAGGELLAAVGGDPRVVAGPSRPSREGRWCRICPGSRRCSAGRRAVAQPGGRRPTGRGRQAMARRGHPGWPG